MKKGFTLVELLAVIVILAIIALITIPLMDSIIESSNRKTAETNARNYIRAVDNVLMLRDIEDKAIFDGIYKILNNGNICLMGTTANCSSVLEIELDGTYPTEGKIKIESNKVVALTNAKFNDIFVVFNDKNEITVKDSIAVCKLNDTNKNNDIDTGEVVTCETEKFYVIPNDTLAHGDLLDTNSISMLASKNITIPADLTTEYPVQDDGAGTMSFDYEGGENLSGYWSNNSNYTLKEGQSYKFVYDDNSDVAPYVNKYNDYLKSLGVSSASTTLISYEQLINLGCKNMYQGCPYNRSWIFDRRYWTGSAYGDYNMVEIYNGQCDDADSCMSTIHVDNNSSFNGNSIRPVVIINKSEIE